MPLDVIASVAQEGKPRHVLRIEDQSEVAEIARNWKAYVYGL